MSENGWSEGITVIAPPTSTKILSPLGIRRALPRAVTEPTLQRLTRSGLSTRCITSLNWEDSPQPVDILERISNHASTVD